MFEPRRDLSERFVYAGDGGAIASMSFAEPASPRCHGWAGSVKRAEDIIVALVALAVLAVPLVLIALLIWWDSPGPALFRQRRIGLRGAAFVMWKFRTMYRHAEPEGELHQACRGDHRVTRVGGWLRCRSFDEVPQLVNVLRGEMSLVGPRPHAPGTCAGGRPYEQISPRYGARHRMRPGITGLAQVRGWRGETETEDKLLGRVDSDLEYIETWSLWMDLVIMARTIAVLLRACDAY
jgi:lipopolysaccharide/colanic/teichoic acid biosynthesis glycosyltransferase